MASLLNPYLNFDGDARPAMEFYQGVFGGELSLMTFGEQGMADTPHADKIMHGSLKTEQGYVLMGADAPPGTALNPGDNITVCLSGDDADLLRGYFAKLSEGGTVSVPLEKQMWGDEYGACTDRFGINWMVDISTG
ncbi:VOC family protein [Actinomadura sp. NBRC 104412]|uniref:VOC family protein n=1 Tax=Actinomadura sp. NBRC 104412 TaxID=3032203 RepID=UPI0024A3254F|nr:VOC family protein [Actinomadura sp. NBRC 104412]GLZ02836.1 VOC family protein [Actinomadura sp. NBRC 104412]